tara:strand:- start:132 stop:680 length:549 start_codon:yes stop_codon:yes gene_type:complete
MPRKASKKKSVDELGDDEFAEALSEHKKDAGLQQDTSSTGICLAAALYVGGIVPSYVYTSDLMSAEFDKMDSANMPYLVAVPLISAILLNMGYSSAQTNQAAKLTKNVIGASKKAAASKEALYWSLFSNNVAYLLLFLGFAFWLIPKLDLGDERVQLAYAFSTILPALLIMLYNSGKIIKLD